MQKNRRECNKLLVPIDLLEQLSTQNQFVCHLHLHLLYLSELFWSKSINILEHISKRQLFRKASIRVFKSRFNVCIMLYAHTHFPEGKKVYNFHQILKLVHVSKIWSVYLLCLLIALSRIIRRVSICLRVNNCQWNLSSIHHYPHYTWK